MDEGLSWPGGGRWEGWVGGRAQTGAPVAKCLWQNDLEWGISIRIDLIDLNEATRKVLRGVTGDRVHAV